MRKYKDRDWLNREYWEKELSAVQIAQLCNCGKTTIQDWLKKLNVKVRSVSMAKHLRQGNHCNLSDEAKQWLDGEIMGDGCLRTQSKYSALFSYSSKHEEYINYISDTLNSFGIKQTGKIYRYYNKKWNNYTYRYCSLAYAELLPIRKRWYPNGKKIIPRDLKLTPRVLRQEMIGDGYLAHPKKQRPYIKLATDGFPTEDVKWLKNELNKLGFKSMQLSLHNRIRISAYSTKDFLDYIGKSPTKCYDYKFNY